MNVFIIGLACFIIGVLLSSIVWIMVIDRVTENKQSEDKLIQEVIEQLKHKNQERSGIDD